MKGNNNLIGQAREQKNQNDWINRKLASAEESGFSTLTKEEILEESKKRLSEDRE